MKQLRKKKNAIHVAMLKLNLSSFIKVYAQQLGLEILPLGRSKVLLSFGFNSFLKNKTTFSTRRWREALTWWTHCPSSEESASSRGCPMGEGCISLQGGLHCMHHNNLTGIFDLEGWKSLVIALFLHWGSTLSVHLHFTWKRIHGLTAFFSFC